MIAILTAQTCGDNCWHAREEICRCSCGGANHGVLKTADGIRPTRTAKIQGVLRKLHAVATRQEADGICQTINKATGFDSWNCHTASQSWGHGECTAKMRPASRDQINRWPELTAWRDKTDFEIYRDNPTLVWVLPEGVTA